MKIARGGNRRRRALVEKRVGLAAGTSGATDGGTPECAVGISPTALARGPGAAGGKQCRSRGGRTIVLVRSPDRHTHTRCRRIRARLGRHRGTVLVTPGIIDSSALHLPLSPQRID